MTAPDPLAFFSKAGSDGVSVRSHLTELIHKLLLSKDPDALEKLESLSLEVKKAHFDAKQPGSKEAPQVPAGTVAFRAEGVPTEAWLTAAKKLQTTTDPAVSELPWTAELPDQMPLFSHAGVGLSKEETYRTYLAMQRLQKKHGLKMVRFFGKIFGSTADYVVIEAGLNPEAHLAPSTVGATPPEPPGVGLNAATYFVAPTAVDEFVQLEDVTPEAVVAAMKIRKYFTGDLAAPVYCYPAFPGNEAAYLRAQIARIAQATAVKPAGALMFDEESEATPKPLLPNPDYTVPGDLPAASSWVHGYSKILAIGRCTNVPVEVPEGEDPPEVEEEGEALTGIDGDEPVATYGDEDVFAAWTTRLYNQTMGAYAVAVAASNRWPGAYAAIAKSGDKSSCIYIGHGIENAGKDFNLEAFPPIASESAETEEADDVALEAENALLKEIDEAKNVAENTPAEEE